MFNLKFVLLNKLVKSVVNEKIFLIDLVIYAIKKKFLKYRFTLRKYTKKNNFYILFIYFSQSKCH